MRPCTCDRPECRLCHLYHHDPRYRARWDGGTTPSTMPRTTLLPCRHRGEPTGETRSCKTCGNKTSDIPLLHCAIHGQCTESILLPGVEVCRICPDRDPGSASALVTATEPTAPVVQPQKLLLVNKLSPGDCLVMTGAIESLHRQYPGKYLTGVESACPAVFEHNPHVKDVGKGSDVRRIVMEYPLINQSNQRAVHFLHAYCDFLGVQLGIRLDCVVNRPSLYFSEQEGRWMSRVQELYGKPRKHWILDAGVKGDYTAKGWVQSYWQEVVDRLAGKVLFVQIGKAEHRHTPLKGVVDQIGKTNLRELIRLCRSAEGGVGPVTFIQHAMAALQKPYVCLAGGREPPSFTAYSQQTTLHTIGALSCCRAGGCWVSRTTKLFDGDRKDNELCQQPVPVAGEIVQRCMAIITPDLVVRAIERYHEGGALAY